MSAASALALFPDLDDLCEQLPFHRDDYEIRVGEVPKADGTCVLYAVREEDRTITILAIRSPPETVRKWAESREQE